MTNVLATRRSEQGFTLVELAIVMVIIGLLIGGILKGQELIANAKISSTVAQLKGLDAAMNTFQDKYNALPGDMSDAETRLPNCTGQCQNGAGGGTISTDLAPPTGAADEGAQAFVHLSTADLISGVDASQDDINFGKVLPTVKAGGGMWLGYGNAAPTGTTLATGRHYAVLNGVSDADVGATTGAFSATTVAQIDRKLDDGQPLLGSMQVVGDNCEDADAYAESVTDALCAAYVRVLN